MKHMAYSPVSPQAVYGGVPQTALKGHDQPEGAIWTNLENRGDCSCCMATIRRRKRLQPVDRSLCAVADVFIVAPGSFLVCLFAGSNATVLISQD